MFGSFSFESFPKGNETFVGFMGLLSGSVSFTRLKTLRFFGFEPEGVVFTYKPLPSY